ncbi:MAG: OmpA family protein, partial [Bacillota bacterium]
GMYLSFPNEPYYMAARLNTPEKNVFLALYIHRGGSVVPEHKNKVKIQADIIEMQSDEAEKVTVETMYEDLHQTGQVTLREIQFEYDSAKLSPESESILAEVAQLLRKHQDLELYVVGHTDDTKSFQYNLELSQRRADAVVKALVEEYDISADRLVAGGVGPQAPVATNETEEGRAQNRRVALVKKK